MLYEVRLFPVQNQNKENDESLIIKMGEDVYNLRARYGYSGSNHGKITEKLRRFSENYRNFVQNFGALATFFSSIPVEQPPSPEAMTTPNWKNGFLPPHDAMALCTALCRYNPRIYLEIGSGNSTKFARKAISHLNLETKIVSIDPMPRAEIDLLCDHVIRAPIEYARPQDFDILQENDILFIDSSHRCLQNSDVTCIFLDILPLLKPGVIVHFHDILWPNDYYEQWAGRFYNEQYLLGVLLLFNTEYEILYSTSYVTFELELRRMFEALVYQFLPDGCNANGGSSLWMKLSV